LIERHGPESLRADVLLVPHHGSRSSSSEAFLDAVAPRVAIVQAGYLNRFGHPVPEVAERYRQRGIALIETTRCGAWRLDAPFDPPPPRCERDLSRRYWHHPQWQDGQGRAGGGPAVRGLEVAIAVDDEP